MDIEKLATIVSGVLSAPMYAVYLLVLIVIACSSELVLLNVTIKILIGTIFLLVLPTAPILHAAKKGKTDIFVQEREKRFQFFIIAIIGYLIGCMTYSILEDKILAIFLLCYATVTTSIMLMTKITKVSVHTAGIAGPTTFLVMICGIEFLWFYIFLFPVAWARYVLRAHTKFQLLWGAILAILVTYFTVIAATTYLA